MKPVMFEVKEVPKKEKGRSCIQIEAMEKLKSSYPGAIRGREDNKDRIINMVIWADGIEVSELRSHLENK